MQIQSNLASTIAMAFDECPSSVADRSYVQASVDRTARWLERCKIKMAELNSREDTINKNQLLFGINQGAIYPDIRIDHAKRLAQETSMSLEDLAEAVGYASLRTFYRAFTKMEGTTPAKGLRRA